MLQNENLLTKIGVDTARERALQKLATFGKFCQKNENLITHAIT